MPGDFLHQRQFRGQALRQRAGCTLPHDFEGPVQGGGGDGAQGGGRRHREFAAIIFQRRQNFPNAGGGKGLVDERAVWCQREWRQRFGEAGDDSDAILRDGGGEVRQPRAGDKMRGEAHMHRIRARDARAGECEVHAQSAGHTGEKIGGADIREQRDRGFRHREGGVLGGDAVAAMHGNADAAAEAQTVDQRDIGFGQIRDRLVQRVFSGEEGADGLCLAGHALGADGADIAAGAERALTRGLDHHGVDFRVRREIIQCDMRELDHGKIQRVQRLRAVELNAPDPAIPPCIHHLIHFFAPL